MTDPSGSPADFAAKIARFAVTRRRAIQVGLAVFFVLTVALLLWRVRIASDILDLLPQHFESVQTFKVYDREFSQAHELTFALLDESKECDLEAFAEHFATMARQEQWVLRVMDRVPTETPDELDNIHRIAVPLLFNLPPAEFDSLIATLEGSALEKRLGRLRAELEAGSPRAQFELEYDPLGLVFPALAPARSLAADDALSLTSPDGTLRLVFVITNQTDLGAHACQATMRDVEDFKGRLLASWSGAKPSILVTGRTAYVAELSLKMRGDAVSSLGGSMLLVAVVFWIGFRSLGPLFATLHILFLSSLAGAAIGTFIFPELNMIIIGLGSILFGLGIDFGMVLYGIYQAERQRGADHEKAIAASIREHGEGILFGAGTTAAAFACLLFTECHGFVQLGALIAVSVLLGALGIIAFLFAFVRPAASFAKSDWMGVGGARVARAIVTNARTLLVVALLFFAGTVIVSFLPNVPLNFDVNPRSLEPRDSKAGLATRTITAKMPALGEPLFALFRAEDARGFHEGWNRLHAAWSTLVREQRVKRISTPAAFALDPLRLETNAAKLSAAKIEAMRAALSRTVEREGLSSEALRPAYALIESLATFQPASFDWRRHLPPTSSWWFILDHFLGRNPNIGIGYISPIKRLESAADKEALRAMLTVSGIEPQYSGWSYTLADIIPWAKSKLVYLSALMIVLNLVLLAFLFRRWFPLFILSISLAFSVTAMIATLKLTGASLNLFNLLAFPLVLGIGVDYGIYAVLAMKNGAGTERSLATMIKPIALSGFTTVAGFGSLITTNNPALRGLGTVCALGVAWCLITTLVVIIPACALRRPT